MSKPKYSIGYTTEIVLRQHNYKVKVVDMGQDEDGTWYYECKALNVSPWYQHITREFSEEQLTRASK